MPILIRVFFCCCWLMMFWTQNVYGQVTIRITELPAETPPEDGIYIAGSFNNWATNSPDYRLTKQPDNTYTIKLDTDLEYFEYKFTRGDWASVEGGEGGRAIGNRVFSSRDSVSVVNAIIKTWEDLEKIKITISQLPMNTPHDAAIYITGPFNNWNHADPKFMMERKGNGQYELVVPSERDTLLFKFTRGSWSTLEANEFGKSIPMRMILRSQMKSQTTDCVIAGWEDVSGKSTDFFSFALALSACVGFFIAIALTVISHPKKDVNNLLVVMLLIISGVLTVRFLMNDRAIFHLVPKLNLLPTFILFSVSPFLYLHCRKLFLPEVRLDLKDYMYYLIPNVLLLVMFLPMLAMDNDQFLVKLADQDVFMMIVIVGAAALVFNGFFIIKMLQLLTLVRKEEKGSSQSAFKNFQVYAISLLLVLIILEVLMAITFLLSTLNMFDFNRTWILENGIRLAWLITCVFPFVILWFSVVRPEIFRLVVDVEQVKNKTVSQSLKTQLAEVMDRKKPFLDPDLTMNQLADMLQTNTHTISKVINDGYSKNFYDFVNQYRIDEFKKRIMKGQHKKQTLLAIAHDVGFSSKSTFNRTFKKVTGQTPREYLNEFKIDANDLT